jgi:hypothetical protein
VGLADFEVQRNVSRIGANGRKRFGRTTEANEVSD